MKTALTIAGSDSSGGAGIQADIKTITMNGVYAMSAICALTAQNTMGVSEIFEVTPQFLHSQLSSIFSDIFPDAIKIGMVSSSPLIEVIGSTLQSYSAKNIVLDPVMVSSSGARLMREDAQSALTDILFPLSTLITPNIPEAEVLTHIKIQTPEDMIAAAKSIGDRYSTAVLLKGGHRINDSNDLLYIDGTLRWFEGVRINNPNTHGTGCTLSSAIAANLAKGFCMEDSIKRAKNYISGALSAKLNIGKGIGPMNHSFNLTGEFSLSAQDNL